MKVQGILFLTVIALVLSGCGESGSQAEDHSTKVQAVRHQSDTAIDMQIIQKWQGDFPVAKLELLPEGQRDKSVGYIGDANTFASVWQAFQPNEAIPAVDFGPDLVLFVRNTQFYNRINIGKVENKEGIAEVLAMETLSARPIEDKVAMSMVVVARAGITGIGGAEGVIEMK